MQRVEDYEEEEGGGSVGFHMESPEWISAAVSCPVEGGDGGSDDDDGYDGAEFSFVCVPETGPLVAADDIFADGKIRPIYPVLSRDVLLVDRDCDVVPSPKIKDEKGLGVGSEPKTIRLPLRRLFMEEEKEQASFSSTSSSSSMDDLDAIPPGTYCVWTPPASKSSRCKKSSSTGSARLRWRLRDLVVGRSQSDVREKFVFIPIREDEKEAEEEEEKNDGVAKLGMKKLFLGNKLSGKWSPSTAKFGGVAARQRMFSGQDFGKAAGSSSMRSYVPYKHDLVGLFTSANAPSRSPNHFKEKGGKN